MLKIHSTSNVNIGDIGHNDMPVLIPESSSSPAVDVRLFQFQDKASLVLILEKYHYEHQTMEDGGGTGEPFDQDDYTEWFASNDPDKVAVVAKSGDAVVGFLLLQTDDGMPELVGQHWAITDFYVDADHRKHGVGRKLIQYASSHCIDDGRYNVLEASSVLSNKRASNFYLSLGFTIASTAYEFLDRANNRGHGDHVVHLKKLF